MVEEIRFFTSLGMRVEFDTVSSGIIWLSGNEDTAPRLHFGNDKGPLSLVELAASWFQIQEYVDRGFYQHTSDGKYAFYVDPFDRNRTTPIYLYDEIDKMFKLTQKVLSVEVLSLRVDDYHRYRLKFKDFVKKAGEISSKYEPRLKCEIDYGLSTITYDYRTHNPLTLEEAEEFKSTMLSMVKDNHFNIYLNNQLYR